MLSSFILSSAYFFPVMLACFEDLLTSFSLLACFFLQPCLLFSYSTACFLFLSCMFLFLVMLPLFLYFRFFVISFDEINLPWPSDKQANMVLLKDSFSRRYSLNTLSAKAITLKTPKIQKWLTLRIFCLCRPLIFFIHELFQHRPKLVVSF